MVHAYYHCQVCEPVSSRLYLGVSSTVLQVRETRSTADVTRNDVVHMASSDCWHWFFQYQVTVGESGILHRPWNQR